MNWQQLLDNPWVVGIIGGIPSGLLVNWLTGPVLGKRENREYLQKINSANKDVVYAIRSDTSEGQIPVPEVLASLINATARRYGVEPSDLYTPTQISEELVKEVMDSSFISSAQKNEYCGRLADIVKTKPQKDAAGPPAKVASQKTAAEYRQRLISAMSMMLGLMAALMTVSYSLFGTLRSRR